MAKVKLPALSGVASGKLGDIVFAQRYGQTIARLRTKPTNPNTPSQQVVRHNLSALSQAWRGSGSMIRNGKVQVRRYDSTTGAYVEDEIDILTTQEKSQWEQYAQRTKGYKAFGRLAFIGTNIKRLKEGADIMRTPNTGSGASGG